MDLNKILEALISARYLIDSEIQCVCDEDLMNEYISVSEELTEAIDELQQESSDSYGQR